MNADKLNSQMVYLKDYVIPQYLIEETKLDIDLRPGKTTVVAQLRMQRSSGVGEDEPLCLDGEQLKLLSIKLDGKLLGVEQYEVNQNTLLIKRLPSSFTLEIINEIVPEENTALSGLYKSGSMYCTQCEAEGFRRITYYLDRPDVMSKFTVTLHASKRDYPVLLANGDLVASGSEGRERHFATWVDPFKKPCYLFAMVAGDLVCVEDYFLTMHDRLVKLRIFVDRPNMDLCSHAMAALKKAMAWDEKAYGREYDLDTYMIVAANDFNMGAMENKGLNIFNAKYVLVSPDTATDLDYEGVDIVIGHEYFHNWSGNRVTCRDWFQLSLKEGFTVFREHEFTQSIMESPVVRIDQVQKLLTRQFPEDAGPLAHPVRPDAYMEINNFYTMTIYEKGAEVIRMMKTILGPEKFRKGTDLYFTRFDGQAVTTDDFAAVMQEVSGIDLQQFKLWYTQAGTPQVTVQSEYDDKNKIYTLRLAQYIAPTPGQSVKQVMHIPIEIGLLDNNGQDMPIEQNVLSLREAEQTFVFKNIQVEPRLSILRGFSAPVKLQREISNEDLAFLVMRDNDGFARWYAAQSLYQNILLSLIADFQHNKELSIPVILEEVFEQVLLNDEMDLAMKAVLLVLPSMQYMIETMQPADPDAIYQVKRFVVTTLAKKYHTQLSQRYKMYQVNGPYKYNAHDVAARSVRNVLLAYLMSSKDQVAIDLGYEQYKHANNMTDTMAALGGLSGIVCNERIAVLLEFYDKWSGNQLVVNKWLSVQATADLDDALQQVQSLLQHPAFDIKNPNKVYALIGGFCVGNPKRFHDLNGSGYRFLADTVIELDKLNPQVAARMLQPLTTWQKFDTTRQDLMRKELQRIGAQTKLSSDVLELVTKALVK